MRDREKFRSLYVTHTCVQRDELVDRVRWLLEECDSFEGFQLFTDCEGLWGGVSDILISDIRDQLSTHAPIVVYSCSSSPLDVSRTTSVGRCRGE